MFVLSKRVISQYVRSSCSLRLRMDLHAGDKDRAADGAPKKDSGRQSTGLLTGQGRAFESEKFAELEEAFPDRIVRGRLKTTGPDEDRCFDTVSMDAALAKASPGAFLLEAEFVVTPPFVLAHGLDRIVSPDGAPLGFSAVRPDNVHVVAHDGHPREAIRADGSIVPIPAADRRSGLMGCDIKLSTEASPGYFAELAYYAMALDGWLAHTGRSDRYVVLSDARIWPGNHDGSHLRAATASGADEAGRMAALLDDMKSMPAEVVLGRVVRILRTDLVSASGAASWRDLPWHVDGRCVGCDYLGYRWTDADVDGRYCWPRAESEGSLCRVAGLSEGARRTLERAGVSDVAALAALPPDHATLSRHQTLKSRGTVAVERARRLVGGGHAGVVGEGGNVTLPRGCDVALTLSAEFDVGSGMTFALGYALEWPGGPDCRDRRCFLVEVQSLACEGAVFRDFLLHVTDALLRIAVTAEPRFPGPAGLTFQTFVWDEATLVHLRRLAGRHMDALLACEDEGGAPITRLAWLFPSDDRLDPSEFLGRRSPVTVVGPVARALLAAPLPHHYGLFDLANSLQAAKHGEAPYRYWAHHFFFDPLTDHIPSERGHEIWHRKSPFKSGTAETHASDMRKTVEKRLSAVRTVRIRLVEELGTRLTGEAPSLAAVLQPPAAVAGVCGDGLVILEHARLMEAAQALDNAVCLAMPPSEREARFATARLGRRLSGSERDMRLGRLAGDPAVMAFRLRPASADTKVKIGDMNRSLLPEAAGPFADWSLARLKKDPRFAALATKFPPSNEDRRLTLRQACAVEVVHFDRAVVGVRPRGRGDNAGLLRWLSEGNLWSWDLDERAGPFATLDPLHFDGFVSGKLVPALKAAGFPEAESRRPLFRRGVARVGTAVAGPPSRPPLQDFVWDADATAGAPSGRDLRPAMQAVAGLGLTDRQLEAVEAAVGRRLALLWGPPGTGKSKTCAAMILAVVAEAEARGLKVRIAITGPTWVAVDNVFKKMPDVLEKAGIEGVRFARLASDRSRQQGMDSEVARSLVPTRRGDPDHDALAELLEARSAHAVVAATPHQLAKLGARPDKPWLDFMLVDEASQMDLAHAFVALSALAPGATLTVVGDHLQMAPIHPVPAPDGQEHLFGSIYDFYRLYRRHEGCEPVRPVMLDRSYRSNAEIVEFVRKAGYGPEFSAAFPDQRARLAEPIPTGKPSAWPSSLPWSDRLAAILDPDEPLVAVVTPDAYASQRNEPEAALVAACIRLLMRRLCDGKGKLLTGAKFFEDGVGVVTPHRAQQSAVIEKLLPLVDQETQAALAASVDTVERFQGQERLVMFASYGIGDIDQIGSEEEFLYSLTRFNVVASRAQCKLVVFLSRNMVDHLPRDGEALRQSRLVKNFAALHLGRCVPAILPGFDEPCELRFLP